MESALTEVRALKAQDEAHITVLETTLGDHKERSEGFHVSKCAAAALPILSALTLLPFPAVHPLAPRRSQAKHDDMLVEMQAVLKRDEAKYSAALTEHEARLAENTKAMARIAAERDSAVAQLTLLRDAVDQVSASRRLLTFNASPSHNLTRTPSYILFFAQLDRRVERDAARAEQIAALQAQLADLERALRSNSAEGAQMELRNVETRAQLARAQQQRAAARELHRAALLHALADSATRAFDALVAAARRGSDASDPVDGGDSAAGSELCMSPPNIVEW